MNYGELKTAVLAYAHRPDLTNEVVGLIRLAEGMIRRELRALSVTGPLTESDRSSEGVYNLPSGLQELRAIYNEDGTSLEQRGLREIKTLSASADPLWYAVRGSNIEFRGVPGTNYEFEIEYLGHPATLVSDSDTNTILTNHEGLYLYAALFYLYQFTQDTELAQGALDTYRDILEKLNEQAGRKLGGAAVAGAYNLYGGNSSY